MASITSTLHRHGGVASVGALARAGISPSLTRAALRSELVLPIRKGWVRLPDAPAAVVRAVEVGGRLACISAAAHLGLWTMPGTVSLHVGTPRHSGRATAHLADDLTAHWTSERWRDRAQPIECVPTIIRQMLDCEPWESAIATIDSALNGGILTARELATTLEDETRLRAAVLNSVDSASQSGLESLVRIRLRRMRLGVRTQVAIPGVGEVDLIVGDRLVVETDGRRWHSSESAFASDRHRDLVLASLGYRVLRLTYAQVIYDWNRVELAIREIVMRNDHRWPPTRSV